MCKVLLNKELNGVELYFEGKPSIDVRKDLKNVGFSWHGVKKCWYAKQNEKTLNKANIYSNNEVATIPVAKEIKQNKIFDLFAVSTYIEADREEISTKDIAKEVRKELKARFPFCKFSVTSDYSHIHCELKSSPFSEDSKYLKAILEYSNKLIESYNYCTCYDPYADYGSSYHFYFFGTDVTYDYIQIESIEDLKEICNQYDTKEAEAIQLQREKEEIEYQKYCEEEAIKKAEYEKREAERKVNHNSIESNVKTIELSEKEQYFILNAKYANLNKNNTIAEYQEEIDKKDYILENTKITKEIYFSSKKDFENFSNMLLSDFSFIDGTGGSYTDDLRINSMSDYNNMSQADKNTVEWLRKGIAIYYKNELQYVVDAQGYCYARYVGLVDKDTTTTKEYDCKQVINYDEVAESTMKAVEIIKITKATIEKNDIQEKNLYSYDTRKILSSDIRKNKLELNSNIIQQIKDVNIKDIMYNCINKTDTATDQFKEANIKNNTILTIVRESMIVGASVSYILAQDIIINNNDVVITCKVPNKKGLYKTTIKNGDSILVYEGQHVLDQKVLYNFNENSTITKYGSYDKQALIDVLNYFKDNNINPTVNTVKPLF